MQKNWYVVYTKTKCEKKVSNLLTKKKIENFCPLNCKQIQQFRKSKSIYEPLFNSYVFVYINEIEINLLRQIENVLNVVYWKGRPAIIQQEEIDEIKEFVSDHRNIRLEKSTVSLTDEASIINRPNYSIDGNIVMIKNKFIRVNLPSLGFTMIAEIEREGVMGRQISFGNQELLLQ